VSTIVNNVAGTGTATSPGVFHVTGALEGFVTLASGLSNAVTYDYKVVPTAGGSAYQTGKGTWATSGSVLTSTSVTTSSNSGLNVDFGADALTVYISADAATLNALSSTTTADNHIADTSGAHAASAISVDSATLVGTGTNAQAVFEELDNAIVAVESSVSGKANTSHTQAASTITDFDTAVAANSAVAANTAKNTYPSGDAAKVALLSGTNTGDQSDRFWYKASTTTPILLVVTGQSNPDGVEAAVTNYAQDSEVFVLQFSNTAASSQDALPSGSNYVFNNVNPAATATLDGNNLAPYCGVRLGNRGSLGVSLANEMRAYYNRPVYLINYCYSAAEIEFWYELNVNGTAASGDTVNDRLQAFIAYALANTPALADVDYPDVLVFGQSESNAGAKTAKTLTPVAYKTKWAAVYDDLCATCISPDITDVYLIEPTQYVNWTGSGSLPGGTSDALPWKWEGLNAVVRYHSDKVTLVSSIGIPWNTSASGNYGSAAYVHFTGDGNNAYGKAIFRAIAGRNPAARIPNTEVVRDKTPALGGSLDCNSFDLTEVDDISAASGTITTLTNTTLTSKKVTVTPATATVTSAPASTINATGATITYNYVGGQGTIVLSQNTHVFNTTGGSLVALYGVSVKDTLKNTANSAVSFGGCTSFNANPVLLADNAACTMIVHTDYACVPAFAAQGASGSLAVTILDHFTVAPTVGANVTVATRTSFKSQNITGSGAVTTQVSVSSGITSAGATNSTHFLMGSSAPTGNYGIYQASTDTLPHRWNAGQYYKYVAKTANYTGTAADHMVHFTANTSTFTFPAGATSIVGQELILRNDSGNNLTLAGNGSTLTPSTVIATASFRRYAYAGGSNWYQVG